MIVCKLELWPGGDEDYKEHLGTIFIANNFIQSATTEGRRGDYHYELFKKRLTKPFRKGRIRNFPRLSYHPWNLIREILNQTAENNHGRI